MLNLLTAISVIISPQHCSHLCLLAHLRVPSASLVRVRVFLTKRNLAHRSMTCQSFVVIFLEIDERQNIVLVVRIHCRVYSH